MTTVKTTKKVEKTEKPVAHRAASAKSAHVEGRFKQGRGGRKTATAQVRVYPKGTGIVVNGKEYTKYFAQPRHQLIVSSPLEIAGMKDAAGVTVLVRGGGINAQAEAVRHGIARALVAHSAELRKPLKREGFLKRDPRAVERKKYGLKKARRAPQWAKR